MSARPNAPLDDASMSDRRSPPRHARGEPPARDRGGAGAAPAVPPGMGARETPNGPPKHSTSNWGRGAPRAPVGGTPAGERAQGYAPNAPTSALGRQPSSEGRRPSMFDYARRGDDRGAPPPPPPPGLTTPGSAGDDGTRERGAEAGVRRRAAAGDGWGAARAAEFARERALERATESVEPTETAGDAIGPAEELHGRGFEWIGEW